MEKIDFSFAHGGALANQLRKMKLLRQKPFPLALRMGLAISLSWLPILIFTASEGVALRGKVQIPFLFDWVQYARFLVALPLAIWAEAYISPRFEPVLRRFLKANIISGDEVLRFRRGPFHKRTLSRDRSSVKF